MTLRRSAAVVAAAATVLVVLLLAPASAARLTVTSARLTTLSDRPCSTAPITAGTGGARGTVTTVVLSGVPAACRGQLATLRVYASDGTALAAVDTTATLGAGDSTTVTVPSYTASRAAGVALTVGSWGLPVTWTAPAGPSGPVTPGPGTTLGDLRWTLVSESGSQACVVVPVTAAQGAWRIDLNVAERPFNGVATAAQFQLQDNDKVQFVSTQPRDGVLSVVGKPGWQTLRAGQTLTVQICNWNLPFPAYDPALTYTQSVGAVTGSAWDACLPVTLGVVGTPDFYAGWQADVDIAPLAAYFRATSERTTIRLDTLAVRSTGDLRLSPLGGTVYRLAPGAGWGAFGLRDGEPKTVSVCASAGR